MFKRFTDCDKWDDAWYCGLSHEYRTVLSYLWDKSDNAGVYKVNLPLLEFQTNTRLDVESFFHAINAGKENGIPRLVDLKNGRWLLTGFVKFQYGELGEKSNLHKSVKALTKYHNLSLHDGMAMPSTWDQVKVKVQVKEKVKEKEEEVPTVEIAPYHDDGPPIYNPPADDGFNHLEAFKKLIERYPNRVGEPEAKRLFCLAIDSVAAYETIKKALDNYLAHLKANKWRTAKDACNWFGEEWMKWIDHQEPEKSPEPEKNTKLLPPARDYSQDNAEFKRKQAEWEKEQREEAAKGGERGAS